MSRRDDLWNEAMALLLSWQSTPDDENTRNAVRTFCAQSPEHRAAWDEAKRVFLLTGAASAARGPAKRGVTRRQAVAGLAGLVVAGTAAVEGPALWRWIAADRRTGTAEISRSQLPDGSWLTLGPDSAVDIAFTTSERRLRLVSGMAFCETAEEARPFICEAPGISISAKSAIFELRSIDGRKTVGVENGGVTVRATDRPAGGETLSAGDWLSLGPAQDQMQRGRRDPNEMAAWRRNQHIAEEEPVGSVVAEIARWKPGRVLIPETSLAAAPVSGLYDLSNPDAALAAVVAPYGGRVRTFSPWLTIITTI